MTSSDTIVIHFPEPKKAKKENSKGSVQDSERETALAKLFQLTPNPSRIGVDAWDEFGNSYELKSTSKGTVSTARDFNEKTCDKYESCYWLISTGRNTEQDGFVTEHIWFLSPCLIKPWLDAQRRDLARDTALAKRVMEQIQPDTFTPKELARLEQLLDRGKFKNDPNIPKSYLEKFGIEITDNHPKRLRELIQEWPLDRVLDPEPVWYRKGEDEERDDDEFFQFKS